jgi:hypothetical protein
MQVLVGLNSGGMITIFLKTAGKESVGSKMTVNALLLDLILVNFHK